MSILPFCVAYSWKIFKYFGLYFLNLTLYDDFDATNFSKLSILMQAH